MKLKDIFKKDREQEKEEVVSGIINNIFNNHYSFTHLEQTEILNRVSLRVMERKKEARKRLLEEARELQNSLVDIKT